MTPLAEVAALVALLAGSAFCSSAETLFFSLDAIRLRRVARSYPRIDAALRELTSRPTRLLSTVLILNTLVNIAAAAVFYRIMRRVRPDAAETASILVMTGLLLVFGEFGPKRLALRFGPVLAPAYVRAMRGATALAAPLRRLLERITAAFEPVLRPRGGGLSGEEFRSVVEIGGETGIIDAEELSLIKAIISLESMVAADAMTPRVDLKGIDLADDPASQVRVARASRRHFLPLYRDSLDNVEGFLDVRRYLLDPAHSIAAATIPPFFVPENIRLNRLLAQFQAEGRRVALVVDEFGGTSGMITRGDIIERITGEIYQEMSRPRPIFQEAGPNRWLVDASFSLGDLNRKLGLELSAEGADRLAGWLAAHAGHIPRPNEIVEAQGVRVTVRKVERHRATLAHIERLTGTDPA